MKPLQRAPSNASLVTKTLHHLVKASSLEVLAHDIVRRPLMLEQIERGTDVFIPYPPMGTWDETLDACRLLKTKGCQPIPHLPARRVSDRKQLVEWVSALEQLKVTSVLLVAGDVSAEHARFKDSLAVLETNVLAEYGIEQVAVAAYPDGHPHIAPRALKDALLEKLELAADHGVKLRLITQFGFEASPLLAWLAKMMEQGVIVPVSVGVAGPSKMRTLLTYALKCGVRHSINNVLAKPSIVRSVGQWDPNEVLSPIAEYIVSNQARWIENAHLFTFGGLRRTLEWREQLLRRLECVSSADPDD